MENFREQCSYCKRPIKGEETECLGCGAPVFPLPKRSFIPYASNEYLSTYCSSVMYPVSSSIHYMTEDFEGAREEQILIQNRRMANSIKRF